jgi:cysteine desulfurase
MNVEPIYLDHNATTPLLPEVVDAMRPYLEREFGNPSSAHPYGQRARAAVDAARLEVAALFGADPDEIVFTSGGTEANNLAIFGVVRALDPKRKKIVSSAIEHPATREPCRALEAEGHPLGWLGVDAECRIDVESARRAIDAETALVTVMHANNETGTLQPIVELGELAHARGALMHTDAAQSAGKVSLRGLGVDLASIAGHKLNAPKGVGALFVRRGTPLRPVLLGAGHERGLRPGTENVASIVGLGAAARLALARLEAHRVRMLELTRVLFARLCAEIPRLERAGHESLRLPNTLNLLFPGVSGSALLAATPEIAASTGSACHAGQESPSSVLGAMGIPAERALGAVRLSLGVTTRAGDVERAAVALLRAHRDLSGR